MNGPLFQPPSPTPTTPQTARWGPYREAVLLVLFVAAVALLYAANAAAPRPDAADPAASALDASRLAHLPLAAIGAAMTVLFCLGVGAAAGMLHRLAHGKLGSAYRRHRDERDGGTASDRLAYLETALLFLAASVVVGALAGLAAESAGSRWLLLGNWLVAGVLLWPLARGEGWHRLRRAMGWHLGRGLAAEVGCGLLAYLAALPILVSGLLLSIAVTRATGAAPHHPLVDWLRDATHGDLVVVFVLAVAWAPLVEESLFRGGLHHYLRGRLGVGGAVLLASLAFAAIHPQGLAGVPFLASLAAVLALTREWRDSIVASITLHMVHNGMATLLLFVLVWRADA